MAIERYGSKTDIAVKLILVFFVCLLSFSVGTFVGKKFSDNQHRLAQFEPSSNERETAGMQTADHSAHGEVSNEIGATSGTLSDEEIAKLAEEFVSDEEPVATAAAKTDETGHGDSHKATPSRSVATADSHATPATSPAAHSSPPQSPSPAAKAAVTPAAAPQSAPAKPAAAGLAPTNPVPAKAPASTAVQTEKPSTNSSLAQNVAASAVGKYTVQIASYPNETEAAKRAEALKAEGFGAFYVRADVVDKKTNEAKTWYRVSVGLFQTQKEADTYKADLISRAKVTSAIVQKVTK